MRAQCAVSARVPWHCCTSARCRSAAQRSAVRAPRYAPMRCAAPDLHAAENDALHVAWHAVGQHAAHCGRRTRTSRRLSSSSSARSASLFMRHAHAHTRACARALTDVRRATVQLDGTYDHVVALEDEVQLREFAVTSRMRKKGRVKVRSQSCSAPVQATFSARRCRSAMQSAVSLRSGALCYSCTVRARDHCGR